MTKITNQCRTYETNFLFQHCSSRQCNESTCRAAGQPPEFLRYIPGYIISPFAIACTAAAQLRHSYGTGHHLAWMICSKRLKCSLCHTTDNMWRLKLCPASAMLLLRVAIDSRCATNHACECSTSAVRYPALHSSRACLRKGTVLGQEAVQMSRWHAVVDSYTAVIGTVVNPPQIVTTQVANLGLARARHLRLSHRMQDSTWELRRS